MSRENQYLKGAIPFFYRRQILDVMIHAFFTAYIDAQPTVSKEELAKAFLRKYGIDFELYDTKSVLTAYDRTNADLINARKEKK